MKTGWQKKKLGEVCLIKPSKNEARKRLSDPDLVSFVPMMNLGINQKYIKPDQTRPLEEVVRSYTYFAEEDVLLAKITPCFENGKLGIARNLNNNIGFGSSEFIVFRTNALLYNEFLYYFLSREKFREEGTNRMSGAVGHKRVAKDFIENYPIPIPPLPEQERIVAILDEAFEAIDRAKENAEQNLQNARELFESVLEGVFANPGDVWEEKKLGEVCEKITDGTHRTPKYISEGIPFLSVKNLTKGIIDFTDTRFISLEEHNGLIKRCHPEKEDILYTKVGTTGVAKVIDIDTEFSIFVSVALLKIKHHLIYNRYLEYFLNAPFAKKQAQKRTRGTANRNLVIRDIKEITIRFPKSLTEQYTIVTKLDALSAETRQLEEHYKQKLDDLEELKQSILNKAFEGQLTAG